jgi:hypothetical protein
MSETKNFTDSSLGVSSNVKPNADSMLLRGALKLEISTATPLVSAGTEFSIYVVIRNPFPVPVTILRTETHIPVELSDVIWRHNEQQKKMRARKKGIDNAKNFVARFVLRVGFALSDLYSRFRTDAGPRVAIAFSPEEQQAISRSEPYIQISSDDVSIGGDVIGGHKYNLNFPNLSAEEVRRILWDIDNYDRGQQPPVVLFPGNSLVMQFVLKTTRWLTFSPVAHTFQIQVRYEVDRQHQIDTIPFLINIRAAMRSALIGALIGSILGSLVNQRAVLTDVVGLARIILSSIIFAVVIVVAFARKSNVQQIVSIEDFWGGVFIGFLVGYLGESFVSSILGKAGG